MFPYQKYEIQKLELERILEINMIWYFYFAYEKTIVQSI